MPLAVATPLLTTPVIASAAEVPTIEPTDLKSELEEAATEDVPEAVATVNFTPRPTPETVDRPLELAVDCT